DRRYSPSRAVLLVPSTKSARRAPKLTPRAARWSAFAARAPPRLRPPKKAWLTPPCGPSRPFEEYNTDPNTGRHRSISHVNVAQVEKSRKIDCGRWEKTKR